MNENRQPCREELEKQIKIAQSLQETLAVLNSNKELEEVLNFIVNQAKKILSADAVALYALNERNGKLHIEASKSLPLEYTQEAVIPVGMGATGLAISSRQPVVIEDIEKFSEYENIILNNELKLVVEKLGSSFLSLIAVPLILTNGFLYGTLDLYFYKPKKFLDDDIALAKAYANQTILAIENARLRASAERSAAREERSRLARELHDTVNQTLFSISLITSVLPDLWKTDQQLGLQALNEINQLSKGALLEMRSLLFELKPTTLLSAELEMLIQQLVDVFTSHNRISVDYSYQPILCEVSPDVKFVFYRVVQETFRNIEKHGRASHVKISLLFENLSGKPIKKLENCSPPNVKISVIIEDDGVGFFPGNLSGEHFGLRIMHERANEIGASLIIVSAPGMGTRVTLDW